ncbi:MAG: LysR family transcriptional regulator [Lachnospiraceae bacterium]|nr:LysR family transcriptional regulator [Lachnospiraceae bacterium]
MSVNLEYYKVFYYVAQYKSITAAAKALFLSQPTVSHYIRALEEALGFSLFVRSKHGVILTPEAELLFPHARRACEELQAAEQLLETVKSMTVGQLRIGASEMTLHNFLLPYLEQFKDRYPALKLKISSSTTPGALTALQKGAVDFAIVISPLDDTEGLSVVPLAAFQDIVIAGNRFRELQGTVLSLKDLTAHPLICLSHGTATRTFLEQQFLKEGVPLEPDVEPATTDLVTPLAAHNLGLGFVPENFAAEALRTGSVFRIPLKKELPPRHICVVSDSSHPVSLAGRQFLALLPSCSG